jgi:D-alanyl-D-alanine carboxypeptidase
VSQQRPSAEVIRRRRWVALIAAVAVIAVVVAVVVAVSTAASGSAADDDHAAAKQRDQAQSPASRPISSVTATPIPVPTPTPTFDKAALSIDDPASIWVVANKSRALNPRTFVPPDLVYPDVPNINGQPMRQATADAIVAMFAAGSSEAGLQFSVQSAYRSYDTQVRVYNADVAANGQAYADTDTARPGTSEHQTGLAVDISAVPANCSLDACFGTTPQGQWLAANAWRFGFLLRYPADKVDVTGYTYEPWHFRYVGVELATEMHRAGVTTLEEFFGVPGGTVYP